MAGSAALARPPLHPESQESGTANRKPQTAVMPSQTPPAVTALSPRTPKPRKGYFYVEVSSPATPRSEAQRQATAADAVLLYRPKRRRGAHRSSPPPPPLQIPLRLATGGLFLARPKVFPRHWVPFSMPIAPFCLQPTATVDSMPPQLAAAYQAPESRRTALWRDPVNEAGDLQPALAGSIRSLLAAVAPMLVPPTPDRYHVWNEVLSPYNGPTPVLWQPTPATEAASTSSASSAPATSASFFPASHPIASTQKPPESSLRFNHLVFHKFPTNDPANNDKQEDNTHCLRLDPQMMMNQAGAHKYMHQLPVGYLVMQLTENNVANMNIFEHAHRLVTWYMHGPPPAHFGPHPVAMHTCDNPDCLNPAHLKWGSHSTNRPR